MVMVFLSFINLYLSQNGDAKANDIFNKNRETNVWMERGRKGEWFQCNVFSLMYHYPAIKYT